MSPTHTLVLHTGALGDFLLACPAIAHLANDGPVTLVGAPERHSIALAAGLAQKAIPLDALYLHHVLGGEISPPFRKALQGYDRAVLWMRDPGDTLKNAFHAAGVPDVTCAPGLPHTDWPHHATTYYCASINAPENPNFTLKIAPQPGLHTLIAPGSGSPTKNYPLEHYKIIASALEAQGDEITWLLGPAEHDFPLPNGARILHSPDLPTLAAQLTAAHRYLGNDTGPTHLAALVGCPTLALFGPTNPTTWAPRGPHVQFLQSPAPNTWPTPQQVLTALHAQ